MRTWGSERTAGWLGVVLVASVLAGCGGGAASKRNPKSPPILDSQGKARLAQAYVKAGRLNEARTTLAEAVEESPDQASLQNFYGQVCLLAGRYDDAETALKRALELDPYLTDAHNNLGALYDKVGRKDEAEREFRRALEDRAYPTPEKVHLNLGLLYSSQGRTVEAVGEFRKAVEINPKYYQAHFELASILDEDGQLKEAAREYEVAAPAYRGSGDYHYRLGFAYLRLGDRFKAREHLSRVLEVAPGSSLAVQADELLAMMD